MGVSFTITYKHKRFAALKAERIPSGETPDGKTLWPYPLNHFMRHTFTDFVPPNRTTAYSGDITIAPLSFEMDSFYKGRDRALEMQKTPQGYVRLPTVVVQATINLDNVPKSVVQTIKWFSKIVEKVDYKWLAEFQVNRQYEFLKAAAGGEKKLFDFVAKHKQKPEKIFILARPDDEEFEEEFGKNIDKSASFGLEEYEKGILRFILQLFQNYAEIPNFDFKSLKPQLQEQIPHLAVKMEQEDREGKNLRWEKFKRIGQEISAVQRKTARNPQNVNARELGDFGLDFFALFQHFWNLVIRYYKYEKMQHWMEELPSYSKGLFFIRNSVFMNQKYPILPYANIHFDLMLNTDVAHYINNADWINSLEITNNYEELAKYAGGFEIGGIFSQAFQSLTDREFEAAAILSIIGLDASMTEALHYIDSRNADNVRTNTPGPKVGFFHRNYRFFDQLGLTEEEYDNAWNLISSKDDKTGLLEVRNEVVHHGKKLPGHDMDLRNNLLTRMSSTRLMAYRLVSWANSQPRLKRIEGRKTRKPRKRNR